MRSRRRNGAVRCVCANEERAELEREIWRLFGCERAVLVVDNATDTGALYDVFKGCWAQVAPESPNAGKVEPVLKVFITHPGVSMRQNLFGWLVSALLLRRWRQWRRDSQGILALLATAGDQQSV